MMDATCAGRRRARRAAAGRAMRAAAGLALALAAGAALGGAGLAGAPGGAAAQDAAGFAGNWMGSVAAGGAELRLRFEIAVEDGAASAVLFSVDQGNARIPVDAVEVAGSTISISIPMIGASFEGELGADGAAIEGVFAQMGAEMPLALERLAEGDTGLPRPQDPVEPYPYLSEDVGYPNPEGGHVLAGTFTRPSEGGPFPAVVLITGSGPQNRDEELMGHRPFLVLSDHLTRRGIAVLRFDDRGVGESTGDFASAVTPDFASDALAGVAYLKTRDDVDPGAIGLAGHSEGGLVAPIAANRSDDLAFIVLMAGPGVGGERILYAQGELIARAGGATDEAIARQREQQRAIFDILKTEPDAEAAAGMIGEAVRAAMRDATEEERAAAGATDEESLERVVAAQVRSVNTPWFRFFLTYDPAAALERVAVPVLAINGEKDLQVPYEENLREIAAALERGGNDDFETRALPDHNHLFQRAETGAPSEYAAIEETWSVESMELVAEWILRKTGRM